jgi:hypothetical protein
MVVDAARTVAAASRRVRLRCLPEVAAGFARLGVAGAPGVTMVTDDDR